MDMYNLLVLARHPVFRPLRRILRFPRPSYKLWTDASGQGYGGHLGPAKRPIAVFQHKRLRSLNLLPPLAHHSIQLDPHKIELHEATALYLCMNHWRPFLRGSTIEAYMDNMTICEQFSGKSQGQKDTSGVLGAIKELAEMEDMTLSLTWVGREYNRTADGLSKFASADDPRFPPSAKILVEKGLEREKEAVGLVKKVIAGNSVTPST